MDPRLFSTPPETNNALPRRLVPTREMFSCFELNKDPEASAYMPYDQVVYPSLLSSPPAELDTMWMAGHLDQARRTKSRQALKSLSPFLSMPEGTLLPRASIEYRKMSKERRKKPGPPKATPLSEAEQMRLKELADELLPRKPCLRPYASMNRKLRKACALKKPKRFLPSLRCDAIAAMTNLSRIEHEAQKILAIAWRRFARKKRLAERRKREACIVPIQACARSLVARRLIAKWWSGTQILTVKWQASLRRALATRRAQLIVAREHVAAVKIQRTLRGFAGRLVGDRRRRDLAAIRFQRLYRGAVGRCIADLLWLDKRPIKAQCVVRGALTRIRVDHLRKYKTKAAVAISRCYRGYVARVKRAEMLETREDEALKSLLRELAAEVLVHRDRCAVAKKRMRRGGMEEKVASARDKVDKLIATVEETETYYEQAKSDLEQCTPRSISAGWTLELERNIADHRNTITKAKTSVLFDGLLQLAKAKEAFDLQERVVRRHDFLADEANNAREAELRCIWARESRRRFDREEREKRQRVGDERRRWRVTFHNSQGKPLKRQPTEKCLEIEQESSNDGVRAAISQIQEEIEAQNWMNQVAQFDKLFAPLQEPYAHLYKATMGVPLPTEAIVVEEMEENRLDEKDEKENEVTTAAKDAGLLVPISTAEGSLIPSLGGENIQTESAGSGEPHSVPNLPLRQEDNDRGETRPARRRRRRPREHVDRIPWSLLDELDAEKVRLRRRCHCVTNRAGKF